MPNLGGPLAAASRRMHAPHLRGAAPKQRCGTSCIAACKQHQPEIDGPFHSEDANNKAKGVKRATPQALSNIVPGRGRVKALSASARFGLLRSRLCTRIQHDVLLRCIALAGLILPWECLCELPE